MIEILILLFFVQAARNPLTLASWNNDEKRCKSLLIDMKREDVDRCVTVSLFTVCSSPHAVGVHNSFRDIWAYPTLRSLALS